MADGDTTKLSQAARNARVDELLESAKKYTAAKQKKLDAEVKFMKSVIKSRTGAGQLTNQGVADSKNFLVRRISQFLEG